MKVLFIRSGNKGISPISARQGESIKKIGIEINYFEVIGKGVKGYLKNILKLRKVVKSQQIDLLHAHFSFSGFLAAGALTGKPVITSLMGSDVLQAGRLLLEIIRFFSKHLWSHTIVKSNKIKVKLGLRAPEIVPNGVSFDDFPIINKIDALKELGWGKNLKHILFASDPDRPEKNYSLAQQAIKTLTKNNYQVPFEIHILKNILPQNMYKFYCTADVLLMTSLYEGSPNVVKEAMACNCPIVSTDVGDVKWVFGDTEGCFLTSFKAEDVAEKLQKALEFSKKQGRTNGRERIIELGLDSETIAKKIVDVYERVLN